MILIVTAQQLRDSVDLPEANQWIDFSIDLIRRFHVKPDIQCVLETVGIDGEISDHFDGRTLNPGHAIEAAWFIMAEGLYRNDDGLFAAGRQILDFMWERGWDSEFGGILYFVDVYGKPLQEYWHDMKFWWPHNEAIIATLMAFLVTRETKYAQWHHAVHDWAHEHFADSEYGEWFGYLRREGQVSSNLKGSLWKGPFHLPRMQLICWQMLQSTLSGKPILGQVLG
jgi:N-acylglucosamine 2-epimerase